ncbi:hypothetical protein AB0G51_34325 [Streptomyces asoensis]|uniref:hypothetical protein n=1 Tax=Streptomyces asoensis TaxID=249586 RepID=UPI0033EF703B
MVDGDPVGGVVHAAAELPGGRDACGVPEGALTDRLNVLGGDGLLEGVRIAGDGAEVHDAPYMPSTDRARRG